MQAPAVLSERQAYLALDARIQADHRAGDLLRLAEDYAEGAALYEAQGDIDAACYFWTQAYVLALDSGAERLVAALHARLDAFGRMGGPIRPTGSDRLAHPSPR